MACQNFIFIHILFCYVNPPSIINPEKIYTNHCPGAWVSLDKNDNKLHLFLSYFLIPVRNMFPDAGRKTLAMLNASTLPSLPLLAGSLLNELELIEQPFILVLDDYHHKYTPSLRPFLPPFGGCSEPKK